KEKGRRHAPPSFVQVDAALRGLLIDHLGGAAARGDLDLARLFRLRDLEHEIDMEQAVVEACTGDLDVIGELEAALEGAACDAAMEISRGVLVLLGLAVNQELVLLDRDVE